MKLFISTTATKPASPQASLTNGSGAATTRLLLGPTGTGPNVIFDRIIVNDTPLGSNP